MDKNYVIIGGDAAGMSAASKIRRSKPESNIIVFEKGEYISFAACGIPYWLGGVIDSDSKLRILTPETARSKRNIDVRNFHEALSIDTDNRTIVVKNIKTGDIIKQRYDQLIIATGARAIIPPIPGVETTGIFPLRSLSHGQRINTYINENHVRHAVIVGAGYIGLEMAEAFVSRGIQVEIIEMAHQIMPNYDGYMVEKVTSHLKEKGVILHLENRVTGFEKNASTISVSLSQAPHILQAELVIMATGVAPNSEIAESAGIKCGPSKGIKINAKMQTSVDRVWAAGDCVEYHHLVLGEAVYIPLAPSANKGGRIAGDNATGQSFEFPGILGTSVVKVFDYTMASTGLTEKLALSSGKFPKARSVVITESNKAKYYPGATPVTVKLVIDGKNNRIIGAQMFGKADVAKRIDIIAVAITAKMTAHDVAMLDLSYAPPFAPVYDPIHIAAGVADK